MFKSVFYKGIKNEIIEDSLDYVAGESSFVETISGVTGKTEDIVKDELKNSGYGLEKYSGFKVVDGNVVAGTDFVFYKIYKGRAYLGFLEIVEVDEQC